MLPPAADETNEIDETDETAETNETDQTNETDEIDETGLTPYIAHTYAKHQKSNQQFSRTW